MWLTKAHTSQEAPTSTSGSSSLLGFIIAFISAYKSEDRFAKIKKVNDNKM
ncbi:hypothetical protein [Fusobacterium animalis]|uniref:hypothetical protein n=1 Tax=Fusobacterium animalis TaxID=76859 RepID=UPI0030D3C667